MFGKHKTWLAGLAIALSSMTMQVSATTFKIATLSPDGSQWMQRLRAAAQEIKTRSEGRVEFKFYTGGTMGNDQAVLSKIRLGQLQGGALTGGSLEGAVKDLQLYSLPMLFHSFEEVDVVRSRMDSVLSRQLEDAGWVNFGFAEGGFAYVMSKSVPINSVSQLKQHKVWIPDGDRVAEETLRVFQVSPVPLSLGDVLPSLQTGIVDTVASSPIATLALQWQSQVRYLTELPLTYFMGLLAIDRKDFSKLSAADQQLVREVLSRSFRELDKQNRLDNLNAYQALLHQGMKTAHPSAAEQLEWQKFSDAATQKLLALGLVSSSGLQQVQALLINQRAGKK